MRTTSIHRMASVIAAIGAPMALGDILDALPPVGFSSHGRRYRDYRPRPNRYRPHQGKRECERRRRQLAESDPH